MQLQPYTTEPTFAERMDAAYEAGRTARAAGRSIDDCPHQDDTPAAREWQDGWLETELQHRSLT